MANPMTFALQGHRFGMLVVVRRAGVSKWKEIQWECRCDCGKTTVVIGKNLRKRDGTRSCGCLIAKNGITHGGKHTRLYRIWSGLRNRCNNLNNPDYPRYGGAGVTVCSEWNASFVVFRAWSEANGYNDDLMIDRIDFTGNYEPANCRWVTSKISSRNTRRTKLSEEKAAEIRSMAAGGQSHSEIARLFGVSRSNVSLICEGRHWL